MEFGAEEGHGPLTLHWWHGSLNEAFQKHNTKPNGNTLFVGDKGTISAGFDGYKVTMKDGSTPNAARALDSKIARLPQRVDSGLQRRPTIHLRFCRVHRTSG